MLMSWFSKIKMAYVLQLANLQENVYLYALVLVRLFQYFNPFEASAPFLYLLEASEDQRVSDVFRGYRNGTLP